MPQEPKNWTDLHPDFAKNYQEKTYQYWWEATGLSKQDAQSWSLMGLKVEEYKFADWLENKKKLNSQEFHKLIGSEQEKLEEKYNSHSENCNYCKKEVLIRDAYFSSRKKNIALCSGKCYHDSWANIHIDFVEKPSNKNYQELWQEQRFTKNQAQQYLRKGFVLTDFMFLTWLNNNKQVNIKQIDKSDIESQRTSYQQLWFDLDDNFAKKL